MQFEKFLQLHLNAQYLNVYNQYFCLLFFSWCLSCSPDCPPSLHRGLSPSAQPEEPPPQWVQLWMRCPNPLQACWSWCPQQWDPNLWAKSQPSPLSELSGWPTHSTDTTETYCNVVLAAQVGEDHWDDQEIQYPQFITSGQEPLLHVIPHLSLSPHFL